MTLTNEPNQEDPNAQDGDIDFDDLTFAGDVNLLTKLDDNLFIGKYLDARDTELLQEHGIRAIESLDGSSKEGQESELGVDKIVSYRFIDGPGNDMSHFRIAIKALAELVEKYEKVLVHCHAGRSRSPAVVMGYLMLYRDMGIDQAQAYIERARDININPGLYDLLEKL